MNPEIWKPTYASCNEDGGVLGLVSGGSHEPSLPIEEADLFVSALEAAYTKWRSGLPTEELEDAHRILDWAVTDKAIKGFWMTHKTVGVKQFASLARRVWEICQECD